MSRKPNKKIALFVPKLTGGGAERVIINLAYAFLDANHNVDLVTIRKEGPYLSDLPTNLNIVDLGVQHTSLAIVPLSNYLRRAHPDIILSAMDYANVVALLARKFSGVKIFSVISEHSIVSASIQLSPNLRTRLMLPLLIRLSYPLADRIVTVSEGVANDLITKFGISKKKIAVIYNPLRLDAILKKANEPVDHPWCRVAGPPILLSVGRLDRVKDYRNLLHAFALVRKIMQARLIILGEGKQRPFLNSLITHLNIERDVDMPGFKQNPYNFMAAAKVFVISSKFEGFSNALLEALACGCSAVATDCPSGPREIFKKTGVGRLVPVGEPKLLAQVIVEELKKDKKKTPDFTAFCYEDIIRQYMIVCGLD